MPQQAKQSQIVWPLVTASSCRSGGATSWRWTDRSSTSSGRLTSSPSSPTSHPRHLISFKHTSDVILSRRLMTLPAIMRNVIKCCKKSKSHQLTMLLSCELFKAWPKLCLKLQGRPHLAFSLSRRPDFDLVL